MFVVYFWGMVIFDFCMCVCCVIFWFVVLLLFVVVLLLVGCQCGMLLLFWFIQVIGYMLDLDFNLVNDQGKLVIGVDYCGKVVLLYFGYIYCFDVCLFIFVYLYVVMQWFGLFVDGVCILFVLVDLVCDMFEVMYVYVNVFDKCVVGLIGKFSDIEVLSKCYCFVFSCEFDLGDGNYEVSYSLVIYIFDVQGYVCLLFISVDLQDDLVYDLYLLFVFGV